MWFSSSFRRSSSAFSMSFMCIGVTAVITLISEFADGTTEFLDGLFRRGGRDGVAGSLIVYSTRFHCKNSLILPIVFLLSNWRGWIMIYDSKLRSVSFILLTFFFQFYFNVVSQIMVLKVFFEGKKAKKEERNLIKSFCSGGGEDQTNCTIVFTCHSKQTPWCINSWLVRHFRRRIRESKLEFIIRLDNTEGKAEKQITEKRLRQANNCATKTSGANMQKHFHAWLMCGTELKLNFSRHFPGKNSDFQNYKFYQKYFFLTLSVQSV